MALIKPGQGVTDIRGGFGGVYFTRDKSGLHCSAKPRRVDQGTPAQQKQRNAFIKARAACLAEPTTIIPKNQLNRWVSYYIYRALNDLPFLFDAIVTGNPVPDCRGKYVDIGIYNERRQYRRGDGVWYLSYWYPGNVWVISPPEGDPLTWTWARDPPIEGIYEPKYAATGNPVVTLSLTPPPVDYQIPKL